MQEFMANMRQNGRVLRGAWNVSRQGASFRFSLGLLELIPQLLFYLAHGVVVCTVFHVVKGVTIPYSELLIFLLIMFCVDSMGDALMFKGLHEYVKSLRRGQALYYLMSPGLPLFKVLFFRWDLPMLVLGFLCGLAAVFLSLIEYGTNPLVIFLSLMFGCFTHIILTSAFQIIQSYFDPSMPISFGSPASRFYTKPLNFFFSGSIATGILMTLYPAYFMTAFPAGLAVRHAVGQLPQHAILCYVVGICCVAIWTFGLNAVIVKACKMRQN